MKKRQVIIIGGGPGGAATALHLIQSGIKPLIIERQNFPRFHIGESLTGECGNAIRKLDLETGAFGAELSGQIRGQRLQSARHALLGGSEKTLPGNQRDVAEFNLVGDAEQFR